MQWCHGGAKVAFHKFYRIARSSEVHETESAVSRELSVAVSSRGSDQEQRNFVVHNLSFVLRRSSTRSPVST